MLRSFTGFLVDAADNVILILTKLAAETTLSDLLHRQEKRSAKTAIVYVNEYIFDLLNIPDVADFTGLQGNSRAALYRDIVKRD